MKPRAATAAITLGELARIEPLASADASEIVDPGRQVEQVVLAEDFDRLRRTSPHSLVVLHDEAATGGWSLAAALHLAWERNLSAVVVPSAVATTAGVTLARRLGISVFDISSDPVDVALQLAGQVSAPAAARALRLAQCAERLADATGLRGILGVLNSELGAVPVALVAGGSVVAGRAAAVTPRPDAQKVTVEVRGPGDRPWADLVAAVPRGATADVQQTEALLRVARPSLQAAWAHTRLDSSMHAAQEQAAFTLLRRMATEGRLEATEHAEVDAPRWGTELGWRVEGMNRAVWLAPLASSGAASDELTHLVRAAWLRRGATWPLVPESDGWVSWHSTDGEDDVPATRRTLTGFQPSAAAHGLVIGVGRPYPGVQGLMRSVAEARLAAHVAREHGAGAISWFDQVGPAAAIAWLPTSEIAQVAELCLGDVMSARDREALVQTVLVVLDCGGSLSQASQHLGVHRNTVLARIARAKQLGLDFDDPDQRLALHLLCHALVSLWRREEASASDAESLDQPRRAPENATGPDDDAQSAMP